MRASLAVLVLCLLAMMTGCCTSDRVIVGGHYAMTDDTGKVLGFSSGGVKFEIGSTSPTSHEFPISGPTATINSLVQSDLGFAKLDGLVSVGRGVSMVQVATGAGQSKVIVDLVIQIPTDVKYSITSNHDDIPGFDGFTLTAESGEVDEAAETLAAGTYRLTGEYAVDGSGCLYLWRLRLDQQFELPAVP